MFVFKPNLHGNCGFKGLARFFSCSLFTTCGHEEPSAPLPLTKKTFFRQRPRGRRIGRGYLFRETNFFTFFRTTNFEATCMKKATSALLKNIDDLRSRILRFGYVTSFQGSILGAMYKLGSSLRMW